VQEREHGLYHRVVGGSRIEIGEPAERRLRLIKEVLTVLASGLPESVSDLFQVVPHGY